MVPPKPGNYPSRNLCWCPARGQPHPYVRPPLRCNGWCQPCPVDRVLDAGCGQTIFAIDIYREDGHFEIFWPPTKGFYGVFNVFLHPFRILSTASLRRKVTHPARPVRGDALGPTVAFGPETSELAIQKTIKNPMVTEISHCFPRWPDAVGAQVLRLGA